MLRRAETSGTATVPGDPEEAWQVVARRVALAVLRHLGVIVAFSLPAVVVWWHAWDGHLGSTLACSCGDSGQEAWFVAWPAYALAHGISPFFSRALYAPSGVNLLANTSAPLVGTVLAPVTWLAGPIVSTNLALTLAPALSAWGAWVACRRLTGPDGWKPAAWIAGLLFGYSPFVVDNVASGHVMLALLVVPPLMVAALYELATTDGSPWRWGVMLGVLVCVQSLISVEVLAMTAVVLAATLVLAAASAPRAAVARARRTATGLGAALATGGVLTAYPAWFVLEGPRHIAGSPWPGIAIEGNRLFDLWDPGTYAAPANSLLRLAGYEGAAGPPVVYLGAGVLALAAAALVASRRRRLSWVLAGAALVSFVLSLGLEVWMSGTTHVAHLWLPWQALDNLPILNRVAPQRFAGLTDLLVALLVGVGLDVVRRRSAERRGRHGRGSAPVVAGVLSLAGLAAAAPLWATYQLPLATTTVTLPRWFATAGRQVPPGSVVLAYPFPFPSAGTSGPMVWQSVDGMRFSLAGGYAKAPTPSGAPLSVQPSQADAVLADLSAPAAGPLPQGSPRQVTAVRQGIDRWGVRYVVVTDVGPDPGYAAALFTAVIGRSPVRRADAWVWRLDPVAPRTLGGATGRQPPPTTAAAAFRSCTRSTEPSLTARLAPGSGPGPGPGAVTVACVAARLGVPGPAGP